jgi:hypothetical protein
MSRLHQRPFARGGLEILSQHIDPVFQVLLVRARRKRSLNLVLYAPGGQSRHLRFQSRLPQACQYLYFSLVKQVN